MNRDLESIGFVGGQNHNVPGFFSLIDATQESRQAAIAALRAGVVVPSVAIVTRFDRVDPPVLGEDGLPLTPERRAELVKTGYKHLKPEPLGTSATAYRPVSIGVMPVLPDSPPTQQFPEITIPEGGDIWLAVYDAERFSQAFRSCIVDSRTRNDSCVVTLSRDLGGLMKKFSDFGIKDTFFGEPYRFVDGTRTATVETKNRTYHVMFAPTFETLVPSTLIYQPDPDRYMRLEQYRDGKSTV